MIASRAGRAIAFVVIAGLAMGVATQLGQGVLPDGWHSLANSISPWLAGAFLVGSAMPSWRWAAASGPPTLLLALLGYYLTVQLRFGHAGGTPAVVFWSIGALVGGPVFGVAGHGWRHGDRRQHLVAIGLMGAVVVAEGVYLLSILPDTAVGRVAIAIGLVLPVTLGRSTRDRLLGLAALAPWLVAGAAGYAAFLFLYDVLTG